MVTWLLVYSLHRTVYLFGNETQLASFFQLCSLVCIFHQQEGQSKVGKTTRKGQPARPLFCVMDQLICDLCYPFTLCVWMPSSPHIHACSLKLLQAKWLVYISTTNFVTNHLFSPPEAIFTHLFCHFSHLVSPPI